MSTETRLHERDPQVIARDTAYVATALADDAYTSFAKVASSLEKLRDETPAKAKELREMSIADRRARVESQMADLRERAKQDADERIATFEATFDAKAAAGADRIAAIRDDERVTRYTSPFQPVGHQLKVARSQVKGAVTSVRKTVDAAVSAGRTQADTARSQVKAAATSTRRTVDAVVDAGRAIAS